MNIIRITIMAAFANFGVCNPSWASDAQMTESQQAEPAITDNSFRLSFGETVSVWSFDNAIVGFDTEIGWKAAEWLQIDASLPVFTRSGTTGIGDIGVDATIRVIDGKCDFLFADKASFYVGGGLGIPVDGEFSSDNLVYRVSGEGTMSWGDWSFDGGAVYSFVDGDTFVPQLGGFVSSDWGCAEGTVSYSWSDLSVGAKTAYTWSADDGNILTLGPTVGWQITDSLALNGEVGFTLDEKDVQDGGSDFFVSASIGFEF